MTTEQITAGRELIAKLAESEGEAVFAREVRDGCWDHRSDVVRAISGEFTTPRALSSHKGG